MLKKRIIPKFLIRNGKLVKGVRFHDNFREAGNPVSTAKVYDAYGVDELLFVDIDATLQGRSPVGTVIERVSEEVFMPFTVGGGIRSLTQIADLLNSGADKVCINTGAVDNPAFIKEAASRFGDQCIVVGIDYQRQPDGLHRVVSHCGHKVSGRARRRNYAVLNRPRRHHARLRRRLDRERGRTPGSAANRVERRRHSAALQGRAGGGCLGHHYQ
jgi:cyclase